MGVLAPRVVPISGIVTATAATVVHDESSVSSAAQSSSSSPSSPVKHHHHDTTRQQRVFLTLIVVMFYLVALASPVLSSPRRTTTTSSGDGDDSDSDESPTTGTAGLEGLHDDDPKHIMLVSLSFRGHVVPLRRLSAELSRRGHRVTFAIQDEGRDYALQSGVKFVSLGRLPTRRHDRNTKLRQISQETYYFRSILTLLNSVYVPCSPIIFKQLSAALKRDPPDMVVMDIGVAFLGGLDAIELARVPVVINNPSLLSLAQFDSSGMAPAWGSGFSPHNMSLWDRFVGVLYSRLLSIALTPVFMELNQLRAQRGLSVYQSVYHIFHNRFMLVNGAFGLEYPQSLSPMVRMTGPLMPLRSSNITMAASSTSSSSDKTNTIDIDDESRNRDILPASLQKWFNSRKSGGPQPVILVLTGAGSMSYLDNWQVRELTLGLDNAEEWRVLWALRSDQHNIVRSLTSAFRLKSNFPQIATLAHPDVKVVVSPCGHATAQEALYYGKPLLCIPVFGDQPDVAARVADSGAGFSIDKSSDLFEAEEVGRLVSLLFSNSSYTEAARRVGRQLRAAGGVSAAADAVEFAISPGTDHLHMHEKLPWHKTQSSTMWALLIGCLCLLVVATRSCGIILLCLYETYLSPYISLSGKLKSGAGSSSDTTTTTASLSSKSNGSDGSTPSTGTTTTGGGKGSNGTTTTSGGGGGGGGDATTGGGDGGGTNSNGKKDSSSTGGSTSTTNVVGKGTSIRGGSTVTPATVSVNGKGGTTIVQRAVKSGKHK